jgi:hypothetical protein
MATTLNSVTLAIMVHQIYDPQNSLRAIGNPYQTDNKGEFDELMSDLVEGQPVVLALGWDFYGYWYPNHDVVAYGCVEQADGTYKISIFDPGHGEQEMFAYYDPVNQAFSYDNGNSGGPYTAFEVIVPTSIESSWFSALQGSSGQNTKDWLEDSVPGYNVIIADKSVTVSCNGEEDYFTLLYGSPTLVAAIPGSSGIEEGNMQAYAIPESSGSPSVDPVSNESTIFISRVDNQSGQLVEHAYLLNASTTQGSLNFTVSPSNSGLSIATGNNTLNASVTFFSVTQQSYSISQTNNTLVAETQTVNFTQPSPSYIMTANSLKSVMDQGYTDDVNVTVANQGSSAVAFNVTLYANDTIIGTIANVSLAGNSITTLTTGWNTTGFAYGNYVIGADLTPVSGIAVMNVNCTGSEMTLNPPPSVIISPTSVNIDAGKSELFTSNVSGGTGPYSYQWYLNGTAVQGATNKTWTFTSTAGGPYAVSVKVDDACGVQADSTNSDIIVAPPDIAITGVRPSKTFVVEGSSISVNITIENEGYSTETFNVTLYGEMLWGWENDTFPLYVFTGVTLTPESTRTLTVSITLPAFLWGVYGLKAIAGPVPGQTRISDLVCTGGYIRVFSPKIHVWFSYGRWGLFGFMPF